MAIESTSKFSSDSSPERPKYFCKTFSRSIEAIADWIRDGGAMLNKPTHFQARDGKF